MTCYLSSLNMAVWQFATLECGVLLRLAVSIRLAALVESAAHRQPRAGICGTENDTGFHLGKRH